MNKLQNFVSRFKNDPYFRAEIFFYMFYPINLGMRLLFIYSNRIVDYFCKDIIIIDELCSKKTYTDYAFLKFVESKMRLDNCLITFTSQFHLDTFDASVSGNCNAAHDCKSAVISINPNLFETDDRNVYFVIFHELVHLEQLHSKLLKFPFPFAYDLSKQDHFWKDEYVDISNVNKLNYNSLPWEQHANKRAEILLDEFLEIQKRFQHDPEFFV